MIQVIQMLPIEDTASISNMAISLTVGALVMEGSKTYAAKAVPLFINSWTELARAPRSCRFSTKLRYTHKWGKCVIQRIPFIYYHKCHVYMQYVEKALSFEGSSFMVKSSSRMTESNIYRTSGAFSWAIDGWDSTVGLHYFMEY